MRHLGTQHLIKHRVNHVLLQLNRKPILRNLRIMLGGDQHGVQTNGLIVIVILNGHLGLAVRAQVRHFTGLDGPRSDGRRGDVPNRSEKRHQRRSLVGGVAEHHALIAGTLCLVTFFAAGGGLLIASQTGNALVDFGALLGDGTTTPQESASRPTSEEV